MNKNYYSDQTIVFYFCSKIRCPIIALLKFFSWRKSVTFIIFHLFMNTSNEAPWWVCFGWLPMCYPLSNPKSWHPRTPAPMQCNDHMLPMLWKVDKHSARMHNQSYQNSLCLMSQFHNPYGLIFIYLLGLSVDSLNLFHKIDFLLVWVLLTIPKLLRR